MVDERLKLVNSNEAAPIKKVRTRQIPFDDGSYISIINPTTRDRAETITKADAEIEAVVQAAGVLRKKNGGVGVRQARQPET